MGGTETRYVTDPALADELKAYREQNNQLMHEYADLVKQMEGQHINSFDGLTKYDEKAAKAFIKMACQTAPMPMQGRNFGFFGLTSTGKSLMINKELDKDVAETGVGETKKAIKRYDGLCYSIYDIPRRNDQVSYFTMEYISFWKGLTGRLVLIPDTIKEMIRVLELLDAIGLNYDLVINKFDRLDLEERETFKEQIRKEIMDSKLKGVNNVWFVSAGNPSQFPDWLEMVKYLTGDSKSNSKIN